MYTFNDGASGRDCIGDYCGGGGVIWTQQVIGDMGGKIAQQSF